MEVQASEYLRQKKWTLAVDLYNKLLQGEHINNQQHISYLFGRTQGLWELGNIDEVVTDCKNIIKLSANEENENDYALNARKVLVHTLLVQKRFTEAELVTKEWLFLLYETDGDNHEIKKILQNLLESIVNLNSKQNLDNFCNLLLSAKHTNSNRTSPSANRTSPSAKMERPVFNCIYCNMSFTDKLELRTHCQTETHDLMIMSDEGHDWHYRPPPRGFKSDTYVLCEQVTELGCCRYGTQCIQAHSTEELREWKERFQYREMKLQRARDKELLGKSYTEELLEKWAQCPNSNAIMRDNIEDVLAGCSSPLIATVSSKNSVHEWIFTLSTQRPLRAVALLQDTHRNHFFLSEIVWINNMKEDIKNKQEWMSPPERIDDIFTIDRFDYKVTVGFRTDIFGTFRQSIVFDFLTEPVLVKHLCVDVVPDSDIDKINEIRKEITLSIAERWTNSNSDILAFHSTLVSCNANEEWEKMLRSIYPCPQADTFLLSHATVTEKKFTRNNYRERMHELLFVEEMARYDLIAQYNLTTKLQIAHSCILSPNSMAASTAKYSSNGELFASISLGKELSEDTSEGRLILMHCNTVYLCTTNPQLNEKRKVFEALIEDKGKNTIYLRLSSDTVQQLGLTPDSDLEVQIQFQLNRLPYCEWHYTMDKMPNFKTIFPETYLEPNIPWSPLRQWSRSLDGRLNLKQKEAVVAITTPLNIPLPPILVIGPYGTGKTFTLAQAIKELVKDSSNRILLCTHSNSSADLYIKDYLDGWVQGGNENARPLRIYYEKRWVSTVNPVVQKYCAIKMNGTVRQFKIPTIEEIMKHKIVVVTLSTSIYLSAMGLPQGFFTHILLDEAAQAIECETVTPLALANESTRIVLAGDHMQLGPDIFSSFVKERNLHISLLERLYDHYPQPFPCKILLCENYRAHESIIQFTSDSFYDQKLVSSSKQPKHGKFFPLTFFTTRGEDVQDKNSTAFYNNSEVYEVVERVSELKRTWPAEWGKFNDQSIGVVTPYSDQVFRIRSELRKRRIDNVCVERVLNVQGKQFRAIILSTVRTRRTCTNDSKTCEVDYGFLSNSKLLNTAITRAQSLVAVVGDPIALCSVGRCSKVWERFIQICNDNTSLFGITWTQLKLQLDGIELKKIYTLNPLAPEFIPRKYKEMVMKVVGNPVVQPPAPPVKEPVAPAALPPPNSFNHHAPPVVSSFPVSEFSYVPFIYPPPPPRPFVYNIPAAVPGIVAAPPPLPLTNGFSHPPIRVVNPHGLPLVMQQRSIAAAPPIALPKSIPPHFLPKPPLNIPTSNKLIQFMNNVHFPEAQVLNDCINLLPQNMSLADMLLQPSNLQERWYLYLKDTIGVDAAEKFKYLLHTTNQKGSRISDKNIFGRATPQSCDSPTFSWYDSPSNQINVNKPIYMREHLQHEQQGPSNGVGHQPSIPQLGGVRKSNPLYDRHVTTTAKENNFVRGGVGKVEVNGVSGPEYDVQKQLQKVINEEFANLNIGISGNHCSDVDEVFKAFTTNSKGSVQSNGFSVNDSSSSNSSNGRFYKYFQ